MMDGGPGEGRRRGKKKNRQRRKRSKRNRGSQQHQDQSKFPDSTGFDDRSVLGGRPRNTDRRVVMKTDGPPDAFMLFCAYHLGITPTDGYSKPHLDEIARRFSMSAKEVKELLGEHGLDEESIRKVPDFDLVGAQLDIRLAPEGISRTETARDLWQEFLDAKQS